MSLHDLNKLQTMSEVPFPSNSRQQSHLRRWDCKTMRQTPGQHSALAGGLKEAVLNMPVGQIDSLRSRLYEGSA